MLSATSSSASWAFLGEQPASRLSSCFAAILSFVTSIVRENYQFRINDWFDTAQGSVTAALFGKLLPHFFFYCLVVAAYIAFIAGFGGFAPAGSLLFWFYLRRSLLNR